MKSKLLAIPAFASSLLAVQFATGDWSLRRPVTVAEPNRFYRLRISADLAANAQPSLNDLRLIAGGSEIPYRVRELPDSVLMAALENPELVTDSSRHTSLVGADLGRVLAFNRVDLTIDDTRFHRNVQVEIRLDGTDWKTVTRDLVRRSPTGESLTIRFPEQSARYFRVTFFDRDEAPLNIRSVNVRESRRVIEFLSKQAGSYWLYYGAPDQAAPRYELAAMQGQPTPVEITAGQEEHNPAYAGPPASEKGYGLPIGIMIGLLLVVFAGGIALLVVRQKAMARAKKQRRRRRHSDTKEHENTAQSLLSANRAIGPSVRPTAADEDRQLRSE